MYKRKQIRDYLEDYFNLRRYERYGLALVILMGLLFLIIGVSINTTDDGQDLQQFVDLVKSDEMVVPVSNNEVVERSTYQLRPFDPNTVTKENLIAMGLPPSAVKSIINFRSAGFQYRQREDLLKCYGVDELLFDNLQSYVTIVKGASSDVEKRTIPPKVIAQPIQPFAFDPNQVTLSELESMNLPNRFIKGFINYRNAGAQFYEMADVEKVYNLTDEVKTAIAPYLVFPDKPNLEKISFTSKTPERFRFDPNRISKDSLILLGVPESAAHIWINYRNGGKVFYSIEDLSTIYGIKTSTIQRLSDWADFPKRMIAEEEVKSEPSQPSLNLDPNTATLEELMEIKGIGRSYANRILWRRKQLGGFYKIDQIGEAENLPDSTFQVVKYHFAPPSLDHVEKINVNTTSRRAFADHPYITYEVVDRIITHREFVGPKLDLDYLLKVELLSLKEAKLLAPYLTFD